MRDPLYRAIEERLGERLDPDLFERCSVDLLRNVYPGLVPIRGGDDGGMDGAVPSPGGAPLPLVVTTARDVLGNLTKSLESYRHGGGSATGAVLATSRALTPRQRRNLEKRAGELIFTIRNIHDRADFAGRLYRDPPWRKELLGLAGDPPALSALPRSSRPWQMPELLGRKRELDWLRQDHGDALVTGQPGAGKTALLGTLAKEGGGLFLVSRNIGKIADAYRAQRPRRVFVDDAHLDDARLVDSLLNELVRLRQEPGMEFGIVATTWPGHEDDIRRILYLPGDRILRVHPLERKVVAKIVRRVNPRFTDELVGEILDQSEGRPGLAVSLAQWAQRGEFEDLVKGRLLLVELRRDVSPSVPALDALAAFALGGSRGMRLAAAAKASKMPETDMRAAIIPVSGTGVLHETVHDLIPIKALSVKPAALRHALVERTYFSGAFSKSLEPAITEVEDAVACTDTLIGVMSRGGQVPHNLIRTRLEDHENAGVGKHLWERYAWTGQEAARWVLDNHREKAGLVAEAALKFAPDWSLTRLVPHAVGSGSDARHLMSAITNWVRGGRPGIDAVGRRRLLLQCLVASRALVSSTSGEPRHPVDQQRSVAQLVLITFSLDFRSPREDPVDQTAFAMTLGSLLATDVRELAQLWPDAVDVLRAMGEPGVSCARRVVLGWLRGPRGLGGLPETRSAARQEAVRMLSDVIEMAGRQPGIVLWAHRLVRAYEVHAGLPDVDDPVLLRLFPARGDLPAEDRLEPNIDAMARDFASDWRNEEPETVVKRMLDYERQRELSGHRHPNVLKFIPNQLAQHVDAPSTWLKALVEYKAPPEWVNPFMEAAIADNPTSDAAWQITQGDDRLGPVCVSAGLRVPGLPDETVRHIMELVPAYADSLPDFVPWQEVTREWKHRLLDHSDTRVRAAAAASLWEASRRKRPDGALGRLWLAVVVECGDAELLLDVLCSDSDVARAWMLHEARQSVELKETQAADDPWRYDPSLDKELAVVVVDLMNAPDQLGLDDELLRTARSRLTIEDRRDLVLTIPADADTRFFRYLVGTEPDLYAALLTRHLPREAHLAPLQREASKQQEKLVGLAREHGYSFSGDPGGSHAGLPGNFLLSSPP